MAKQSLSRVRPKYIFILENMHQSKVEDLLLEAWKCKILDFTIVMLKDAKEVFVTSYNPFFKTFRKERLSSKSLIFPDKLRNVNGYPFRLQIANISDLNMIYRSDSNEKVINVKYPTYEYFRTFLQFHNFKTTWITCPRNGKANCLEWLLDLQNFNSTSRLLSSSASKVVRNFESGPTRT